jgi:hypothetical protein
VGKHRRGGYVFITWKGNHPPQVLALLQVLNRKVELIVRTKTV